LQASSLEESNLSANSSS